MPGRRWVGSTRFLSEARGRAMASMTSQGGGRLLASLPTPALRRQVAVLDSAWAPASWVVCVPWLVSAHGAPEGAASRAVCVLRRA